MTKFKRKTALDWFYTQIKELKAKLPTKEYKAELLKHLPDHYNTYTGAVLISNVLNYKSTDMEILEALKKVVNSEKLKNG